MGVWSSGDIALTERQMTNSAENVTGPWRYERLDGPGHWMQLEAPDEINRLLIDFLPRRSPTARGATAAGGSGRSPRAARCSSRSSAAPPMPSLGSRSAAESP
jgi:hypothetical protein